jgi:Protein of unknown function (DUF2612)
VTDTIQQVDYDVNLLQAILWQYTNATNLQGLLEAKDAWYAANQTAFWQDWYTNVFNLATADQFGLIVWGIILGLPLYVNAVPYEGAVFSFDAPVGFDQGILGSENGSAYMLPVETQRLALQLRYFQLTSSGTVPETNRMLAYVFANYGKAWLLDYGDMTQAYVFDFPVTFDLQYLFNNYDILPRPAGVASSYIDNTLEYFGFNSFNFNFDNGILFG